MNLSPGSIGVPPFPTAPTTVAVMIPSNNGKEEEKEEEVTNRWTYGMLCKLGERTEQSWRGYRNYTEVKLLDERSETEVEMSNSALVCTQDRSLLVAPFDAEVGLHLRVKQILTDYQ